MQPEEKERLQQQLKDALVAIRKLKSTIQSEQEKKQEPIAIIGMGMRLPGNVKNAKDFWNLLYHGVDAITDIPKDRFDAAALYDSDYSVPGKMVVKQGGFLDHIDQFDGSFFDLSYAEIESMDPQQRILLEVTYEAFENAGINTKSLNGSNTGVYIGVTNNDYQKRHFRSGDYTLINPYSYTGTAYCSDSGRISYLLGLQGPAISIDTACSSSLVATHLAVQSLRSGETDMAVVGAANVIVDPEFTIFFSTINSLSKDSRCKTFDNDANGFIRSEGCGILILKRWSDAQRDGDRVLAVIKGTAVNQDGRSNGFTAPNSKAQEVLLLEALKNARLKPEDIAFIEAHGTGTKIGDPIEMEAIAGVFATHKTKENPLYVGSAKTNIGHTESAAGVVGMMKAVLAVQNGIIPRNLHFHTPNELIDWEHLPVKVPTDNTPWDANRQYIGVSGFGVTGTNAHVIIGPTPQSDIHIEPITLRSDVFVLPLSARTGEALKNLAQVFASFIECSDEKLQDICAMTALKRTAMEERAVFVAKGHEEMVTKLRDFVELDIEEEKKFGDSDRVKTVFVCPGQGTQWVGMAQQLYHAEPAFQSALDGCAQAFSKYVSWNLIEELNGADYDRLDVIQPVLVAVEIALGKLWESKGITPDIVVGHSMGEVAAAYLAGMITLDEAALIICTRSTLMKQTSGQGAMMATDLTFAEAKEKLKGFENTLSIAVQNSLHSMVISGNPDQLGVLFKSLEAEGRFCRMIKVDVASHSQQMEPLLKPLRDALSHLTPQQSKTVFFSTALVRKASGQELDADYWGKNLRNPVQFGAVIEQIIKNENAIFVELSPHPTLTTAMVDTIQNTGSLSRVVSSLQREKDELVSFYEGVGKYFEYGLEVDWKNIYPQTNHFVLLPTYPWQQERFWFDEKPQITAPTAQEEQFSIPKEAQEVRGEKQEEKTIVKPIYQTVWEEQELTVSKLPQSVLIIKDSGDLWSLAERILSQKGVKVEVKSSTEGPESVPDIILHLACAVEKPSQQDAIYSIQDLINYYSNLGKSPQLYTVSKKSQIVQDERLNINIPGAVMWGMLRSIRNEYPEFNPIAIDMDDSASALDIVNLLGQDPSIKEWVIRERKYWTPVLNQVETSAPAAPLSSVGTYLITGGTSGLGLAFAEWLTTKGVRNLALVSRSGKKAETLTIVEKLVNQGVRVEIFQADVSDYSQVQQLISDIQGSGLPTVIGVVHAAGVLNDGAFANLTKEQFNEVLSPKINGSWNLHRYFSEAQLESFILFSSAASIIGTAGQANYSGANMAMDQLAYYRKSRGQAALTINYGNIGKIGMAASDSKRGAKLEEQGMDIIEPEELPALWDEILDLSGAQYMLMKINFERWAENNSNVRGNLLYREVLTPQIKKNEEDKIAFTSTLQAQRHYKQLIKRLVAQITKIPESKIKEDATFKSMGLDSLMAVQLKNKLKDIMGRDFKVADIWTYPTVEKFSEFIVSELNISTPSTDIEIAHANPLSNRISAVRHFKTELKKHLSNITKIPSAKIKEDATFKSLGVDSLMVVQLKNRLQAELNIAISVADIWTYPTVEKCAAFLADTLKYEDESVETNERENLLQTPKESQESMEHKIEKEVDQMSLDDLLNALDD